MLGVHSAREIRPRITSRVELWERGLHSGLAGEVEAEESAREGIPAREREE